MTPGSTSVALTGTQQFAAVEKDQFGDALTSQPTFTWSKSGTGSINGSGLYTAGGTVGTATVSATPSDSVTAGTASVTVTNTPPTVATAAKANGTPVSATTSGTSVALTVLGAYAGGESNLTYTWAATGGSGVTFSANGTNGAKSVTATFTHADSYTFTVTITDPTGAQVSSSVNVTVNQALTTITVSPTPDTESIGVGTRQFGAVGADQFGHVLGTAPTFTWTNTGVGSVNASGLYLIGATPGTATITATSGSVSGTASVTVNDVAPTLSAITVNPNPVMGTSGTLSVTGSYTGTGNLTYAWTTTSTPSGGAATFIGGTSGTPGSFVTTNATFSKPGSYTVQVTVTDAADTTATRTVTFTVIATPTITSFSPTSGPVGTSVVITGTAFENASSVTFGGIAATTFLVNSSTQITATVPNSAVTGVITVTTPGGTAASTGSFTVVPAPTISGFAPTSGPVGSSVTIMGTGLTNASSVTFGGVPAVTYSVTSDTSITATVPTSAVTGVLTVTTPGGTATSAGLFTVIPSPIITSFSPASGPVGTTVVITGTGLTNASGVTFGGVSAVTYSVTSDTSLTATVPTSAVTGVLTVTTPGGTATSIGSFTVIPAPSITSFSPSSGLVGTTVTITGTNLTGATSVKFGGVSAVTFTVVSATSITAIVPAGAVTGVITVTTPGGTATSATNFTVLTAPVIVSISPGSGVVGTVVTITGTGLNGATSVKFNGVTATFTVVSATSITATVPAGAVTGVITVTTPGGTATSATVFTVLVWNSVDVAADPDGTAKVLVDRTDGAATVWLFSTANTLMMSNAIFGPYADGPATWTAKSIKTASDGTSRILWTRSDGAAGLWTLNADGTVENIGATYGPYSDSHGTWSATGLAAASDGTARVLWTRSDGGASEWNFSAADVQTNAGPVYGPYGSGQSAWHATGIAGGSNGTSHLLWTRADGAAGLWTMSATDTETIVGATYGPFPTGFGLWRATSIGSSADDTSHVLWVRGDGAAGLWAFSAADTETNEGIVYGPFPGFGAKALDTSSDQSRVLWIRSDRASGLWTFDASDVETLVGPVYGPF